MRRARALAGAALALGLALFAAELGWYAGVLGRPRPLPEADLLAVYGGDSRRDDAAWALERSGSFRWLVFSDADEPTVRGMERRFGPPRAARLLLEPRARSTAQNARYVARLALARGCSSVLVVTSWWHMPRALFLTDLAYWGSGVRVEGWSVEDAPGAPRCWPTPADPRLWLELGRFWGSLATYSSDTRRSSSPKELGGIFNY